MLHKQFNCNLVPSNIMINTTATWGKLVWLLFWKFCNGNDNYYFNDISVFYFYVYTVWRLPLFQNFKISKKAYLIWQLSILLRESMWSMQRRKLVCPFGFDSWYGRLVFIISYLNINWKTYIVFQLGQYTFYYIDSFLINRIWFTSCWLKF